MNKKSINNLKKWIILFLSILVTILLIYSGSFEKLVLWSGNFGIMGVFISGILFSYGFTAIPATASLIYFTETFNPIIVAFIGGIGTMISDLLIFNYFKSILPDEIENLIKSSKIRKLKKSKLKWIIPAIAGIIIASPLPDEAGVSLLGIYKFETNHFMIISFLLNFIGIFIITGIAYLA